MREESAASEWERNRLALRAVTAAAATLTKPPDFETALNVADSSPSAAVMLAYRDLETVADAAWTVAKMVPAPPSISPSRIVSDMTQQGLDPEFSTIAAPTAKATWATQQPERGAGETTPGEPRPRGIGGRLVVSRHARPSTDVNGERDALM